jgi:hypothetical protein
MNTTTQTTRPALPRLGSCVEVLPNKHGHDYFSGQHYVVRHCSDGDVGLASHPDDEPEFFVNVRRLDW